MGRGGRGEGVKDGRGRERGGGVREEEQRGQEGMSINRVLRGEGRWGWRGIGRGRGEGEGEGGGGGGGGGGRGGNGGASISKLYV